LVERAVERTHRARGRPALRAHLVAEDHHVWLPELLAGRGEDLGPVRVQALDGANEPAVLALVGVGTGLALVDELAADRPLSRCGPESSDDVAEVASGEEDHRDEEERPHPAADREPAAAQAASAHVAHAPRIEVDVGSERHSASAPRGSLGCSAAERLRSAR
jgi:hypothetical protein